MRRVHREYHRAIFFASRLVFEEERWYQPLLHNDTAHEIQSISSSRCFGRSSSDDSRMPRPIGVDLVALLALAKPLGAYMARVYEGRPTWLGRVLGPFERLIYRLAGVPPEDEMDWKRYALAMLLFNAAGLLLVYALQRLQALLPLNPQDLPAVPPDLAFNTAVSFATNTNWQGYGGETTLSYLTQMLGLTVQNFVSAATGMAVLVAADPRLRARAAATTIGNFWVDLTRSTLYILLPLSLVLALVLVSQGVVQTFGAVRAPSTLRRGRPPTPTASAVDRSRCIARWARPPRRSRSSSSAPTAAASSTSTRRTRSRTRRRCRTSSRCWRSC